MDFDELQRKYHELQVENEQLKERIELLEAKTETDFGKAYIEVNAADKKLDAVDFSILATVEETTKTIDKLSTPSDKINLFMSLFKGRDDVFAKRWENSKKGTSGYSPACGNERVHGICEKPKVKCSVCKHKDYLHLDQQVIEKHLRGEIIVGIYALLSDETCWFLSIDFDDEGWQADISTLRTTCTEFNIPVAVERSRSGNGAHGWFFFEEPVSAVIARKFGSALLTSAMDRRHQITFKSYDRLFPNQDTMPKGGFGNLIALPLQKTAHKNCNSVFIDENFRMLEDQWDFLSSVKKLSLGQVESLITELCRGTELGILKKDEEEVNTKPWESQKGVLIKNDFPENIELVRANMLFIPQAGFSQKTLNRIKRLAAFKNPEFYKAQAMRLSTFNKPRVISCSDEIGDYLCLPRGCEAELRQLFSELNVKINWVDKRNHGRKIDVKFSGILRGEQPVAVAELIKHDTGVLCGTTAFGKTVAALKLITERKVNTLILVNKISLVEQWKNKIAEFLEINEKLPAGDSDNKRGRRKSNGIVGQMGGGKHSLKGIIDIAVMQSLTRLGEVQDCVKDYGMVIVDECHHVPAFSFEMILKSVNAKFVYGLTATPARKDGHHPIIFMYCGPIRFRDDAKKQAEKRPFEHYIVPRFTSFRIHKLNELEEKEWTIQELYKEIVTNEIRNQQIVDDVLACCQEGKNCIVLSERIEHVKILTGMLSNKIPDIISVTGGMGAKSTRETMRKIAAAQTEKPLAIVATGRFIGEGFDEPRLDTLFLAMPISWKGTIQQYAGRLHRLSAGKTEVLVYDYIDIHVRMFERMYNRRLSGYAAIGYKVKGERFASKTPKEENVDVIFDKNNFYPVFSNDLLNASREIIIVSPFVTKRRTMQMIQDLAPALSENVKVIVVTRTSADFKNKDLGSWQEAINQMKTANIHIVFKTNIHQKFSIIDQKIVWYGSINLLSYGSAEESMMGIESTKIAYELISSVEMYQ